METYLAGLFIGISLVMGLYNFFLFLSTRDKNYIFYVGYICGAGMIFLVNDGALNGLKNVPYLNSFLAGTFFDAFFFFWLVTFAQSFLNTAKNAPTLNKILLGLNIISLTTLVIGWIGYIELSDKIEAIVGIVGFITLIITATICLKKKYQPARFFLAANLFLAGGTILFILTHVANILPHNSISPYYMKIGMTFEMVFFAIALADRINLLKAENVRAQQQIIDQLTENELLKDRVNRELEEKVAERTNELFEKNKNIMDSIHYAKRIQQSLLPTEKYISAQLKKLRSGS
ncbi:hypothetical protein BH09BAC5_BH09BAC5_02550 [soil metagenome]